MVDLKRVFTRVDLPSPDSPIETEHLAIDDIYIYK